MACHVRPSGPYQPTWPSAYAVPCVVRRPLLPALMRWPQRAAMLQHPCPYVPVTPARSCPARARVCTHAHAPLGLADMGKALPSGVPFLHTPGRRLRRHVGAPPVRAGTRGNFPKGSRPTFCSPKGLMPRAGAVPASWLPKGERPTPCSPKRADALGCIKPCPHRGAALRAACA